MSGDDEAAQVRELVRHLAEERIAPRAAEIDESGRFPDDLRSLLGAHDLFALAFDEQHDGTGTGMAVFLAAVEELAKVCATTSLTLALQETGSLAIKLAGTPEQKDRWLPRLARGEMLCAYALTEPAAGSDASAITTTASREGEDYMLDGAKCFISNAGIAGIYTVFARTSSDRHRGISAFVVEADSPGLTIGRLERKMGLRGQPTGEVRLDGCRIPAANRLGAEGDGFRLAMRVLDRSRPGIAAQALGIAEGATAYALGYARQRESFGRPIIEHQLVAALLADMEVRCAAGRGLVEGVGRMLDEGVDGRSLTRVAAVAKLFCSDAAVAVTSDAIQILGGHGYLRDHPLERMARDAKVTQIYEGTNQIQRLVIARSLARGQDANGATKPMAAGR